MMEMIWSISVLASLVVFDTVRRELRLRRRLRELEKWQ